MSDNGQATTQAASEPTAEAAETLLSGQSSPADESQVGQADGAASTEAGEKPTEQKPSEQKAEGNKEEKGENKGPIEYDLKPVDGIEFDGEALDEFKAIAQELGLENDSAQKLANLGGKLAAKWEAKQIETIQQAQAEWAEQSKVDKRFGGDALKENLGVAKKALDTFGTPELQQLLNQSGLGNHPEVINTFFNIGKAISEDRFVSGSKAPSNANQPLMNRAANALYDGNS